MESAYLIKHKDNFLCKILESSYLHLGEAVGGKPRKRQKIDIPWDEGNMWAGISE
jgi:hypothetical protein